MAEPVVIRTPPVATAAAAPAPAPTPAAPPAPKPPAETPLQVISGFLEPEQQAKLITVFGRGNSVVIQTQQELFASASTTLRPALSEVIAKVAAALAKFKGPVNVLGYTDNVPIRTATFRTISPSPRPAPARWDRPSRRLGGNARITTVGKATPTPSRPTTRRTGGRKNRRVEIVLTPQ